MTALSVKHATDPIRGLQTLTVEDIRSNLTKVYSRIIAACQRVNRDPSSVTLLPVSKTVDEVHIRLSYEAGCSEAGGEQSAGCLPQVGSDERSH